MQVGIFQKNDKICCTIIKDAVTLEYLLYIESWINVQHLYLLLKLFSCHTPLFQTKLLLNFKKILSIQFIVLFHLFSGWDGMKNALLLVKFRKIKTKEGNLGRQVAYSSPHSYWNLKKKFLSNMFIPSSMFIQFKEIFLQHAYPTQHSHSRL